MGSQENLLALPSGTIIQQYQIESVLGHGGFGVVYQARHQSLDNLVAIKEYLPQGIVTRQGNTIRPLSSLDQGEFEHGIQGFLTEAKQLVKLDGHPNIIKCRDYFESNGTAYLVMNLENGKELAEILREHQRRQLQLSEQQIIELILPVLKGLKYIHDRGVLHRDIKPANIFIRREDSQPLLIDFGAAKQDYNLTDKSVNQMHTTGYAPVEQVESEGELGAWTDLHAVGAMIWRIIMQQNPLKVESRLSKVARQMPDPMVTALDEVSDQYSVMFINTVKKSISLHSENRHQSADEFIADLTGTASPANTTTWSEPPTELTGRPPVQPTPSSAPQIQPHQTTTSAPPQIETPTPPNTGTIPAPAAANSNMQWVAIIIAALLALGALGVFLVTKDAQDEPENSKPKPEVVYSKIERLYERINKVNQNRDLIASLKSEIIQLKNIGDDDSASLISGLNQQVQKLELEVQHSHTDAVNVAFDLTLNYKKWNKHISDLFTKKITAEKDKGNINKANLIDGFYLTIKRASSKSTDEATREFLSEELSL